jgi:hypothetical protein
MIKFKDLSIPLKIAVSISFFVGAVYGIAVISGIVAGVLGAI